MSLRTRQAAVAICLTLIGAFTGAMSAKAATQSSNVAIIGGNTVINGGYLPIGGGEFDAFAFTIMAPAAVTAENLAPFDTAVLNVSGPLMWCDTGRLTSAQKTDLVDFVGSGKKLIIYDSECSAQDYSWLPFPFATNNPGAKGAPGTLTIVEENTLSSSSPSSEFFIDAINLSNQTDAVGDMNVMITYNPNWCVDMSGTNFNKVTGPVQTYAKYPAGTDYGLIIYNGLDQDYNPYNTNLKKIWYLQLKQSFNPSNLPCGVTVVGITISPLAATDEIDGSHTVTATLTDLLNRPQPGVPVTFTITGGPNAGATGNCSNSGCATDTNGQVNWTYASAGGVGTDDIIACFVNSQSQQVCSQVATETWTPHPNQPPVADAGANIRVFSIDLGTVNIVGTASDVDGDPLSYRWLEGSLVLQDWAAASGGACPLAAVNLPTNTGAHILTLEVTDNKAAPVSASMTLTIDNSPPNVAPTGDGTYKIGSPVTLAGQVSDVDGDLVTYEWLEGVAQVCESATIQAPAGGTPVTLPDCSASGLALGSHTFTVKVSDGLNAPVSKFVNVKVIDDTAPTLKPTVDNGILWPPNHKMVTVTIKANAADNSGAMPSLAASIVSSEPDDGLGDGDTAGDIGPVSIDQNTGVISFQLRSERSGKGPGRTYTVTITATDSSGNASTATVKVIVSHDLG